MIGVSPVHCQAETGPTVLVKVPVALLEWMEPDAVPEMPPDPVRRGSPVPAESEPGGPQGQADSAPGKDELLTVALPEEFRTVNCVAANPECEDPLPSGVPVVPAHSRQYVVRETVRLAVVS